MLTHDVPIGAVPQMRDGRIAYVDFGNVAQLSARNKAVLIDAVVHAVNEDYKAMVGVGLVSAGVCSQGSRVWTKHA
jgi:predicted unusual protein kinase regulating ubiquinone biosynthesis (AarF/ABC1/UbiB family)